MRRKVSPHFLIMAVRALMPALSALSMAAGPLSAAAADPSPAPASKVAPMLPIVGKAAATGGTSAEDREAAAVADAMAQGYLRAHGNGGGGLDRGPLFSLGRVTVRSGPGFMAEQMGIASYSGQPASAGNLKIIGDRVRAYLLDHGHPFAVVSMDFSTREEKPVLDLGVVIEAGEGFKYGGLKYTGSRIRPEALERLSLLRFGETYNEARLRLAMARLARTGYFEVLVPGQLFRDSTRNLLYPSLILSDLKGNRLSGILGYDSQQKGNGLNGYMDIHLINLRGTARDLDFNFDSKQTAQEKGEKTLLLAYTEPWILGTPIGGKVNVQVTLEDSVYDERSAGVELFQDTDFHSRYLVAITRQFNHDFIAATRSTADIAGLGFQFDARDQVPSTLNGLRLSARVNGLHRDLGDSAYFLVQSINELAVWGNLGRWVGHVVLSGSGNWPLAGRDNRGELYSLGGANTIRGFREKEFLTNLFLYGNVELQFLLAPRSRATVFVVPALINRLGGDVYWRREIGYGAGLESGAKDWTFGISYALNPDRPIGNGFIHMSVTNNF